MLDKSYTYTLKHEIHLKLAENILGMGIKNILRLRHPCLRAHKQCPCLAVIVGVWGVRGEGCMCVCERILQGKKYCFLVKKARRVY